MAKAGYNEPDDIRQYDNDPRSPYYDDGGAEQWTEERYIELLHNITEIDNLNFEKLGELVVDYWNEPNCENKSIMIKKLESVIEQAASDHADEEWANRDEI